MVDFQPSSLSDSKPPASSSSAPSSPPSTTPPVDTGGSYSSGRSYNPRGSLIYGILILLAILFSIFILWKLVDGSLDFENIGDSFKRKDNDSSIEIPRPVY